MRVPCTVLFGARRTGLRGARPLSPVRPPCARRQARRALLILTLTAACQALPGQGDELDLEPPRLLAPGLPPDGLVSPTPEIIIRFSEPLAPESVGAHAVVVVPHGAEGVCSTDLSCSGTAACFEGRCQRDPVDGPWITDMAHPPLAASRAKRLAPVAVSLEQGDTAIALRALYPLAPRRRHTLLVGPDLTDRAGNPVFRDPGMALVLRRVFATTDEASGRPTVWLRSPSPGSADLPRNLARVVVRFSRPVLGVTEESLWLELDDGSRVRTTLRLASPRCRKLAPGSCFELGLEQPPLPARTRLRLRLAPSVHDGAGLGVLVPTGQVLATGDGVDSSAPRAEVLRLQLADGCVVVRGRTDEPADVMLEGDWGAVAESSVGATRHEVALGGPVAAGRVTVTVEDLAGNRAQADLPVEPSPTDRLVITEILANPAGPEPAQELVELLNLSPGPVDLASWVLDDGDDGAGANVLPAALLLPGQYAVVVGKGYRESNLDPPPDPSALVVRLSSLLGASGLSNAGETLALRDPQGRLVSTYSDQLGAVSGKSCSGHSVERVAVGGCDLAANWRLSAGAATPGAPAEP